MSERQESIFIKKYVEILRFKSLVRNQKVKIIKPTKTKKSDEYTPKIKLPYIKVLKNDESPIKRANAQTTSDNNRSNKKNNRYMKEKDNLKTLRGIREINKSTDDAPKKIVKAISDNLYQRLLNNNLKVDNLEKSNSAVNILEELSKDDKEKEKEKRLMIKLPFLSNIKSRYKDYNEANLRKVIKNELDIKNDSLRRRPLSKLKVKKLTKNPQKYYYHILPGNNSKLVEKCLLTRPKWEKTSEPENLVTCNLIWTELSHEMNFSIHGEIDYSQVVNHFEFHNEISNKKNLFINLLRYCEY